eukprot:6063910-Amphidinium_carterae.1
MHLARACHEPLQRVTLGQALVELTQSLKVLQNFQTTNKLGPNKACHAWKCTSITVSMLATLEITEWCTSGVRSLYMISITSSWSRQQKLKRKRGAPTETV